MAGDIEVKRVNQIYSKLRGIRPLSRVDLKNYVKVFLGIEIPDKQICRDHFTPMDYLWYCYNSDFLSVKQINTDSVVWANRGGGKTELAAIATLLDCVFKPGCEVRILGGSLEQSNRMYEYLTDFIHRGFDEFVAGTVLKDRCRFKNGSRVEVMTQSATSVRGTHVHKLRCDEIELFDEEVFAAAKFVTHSKKGITGGMELLSTMHRPYGLMQKAVEDANKTKTAVFSWCLWEVIEKCVGRNCSQCRLWSDCGGKAKESAGYLRIDDCITQMGRSSRSGWESEMLCLKPSMENVVFDDFNIAEHVGPVEYNANLPLYRSIDFGFVNPFVCFWIQVDDDGVVRVIDEYSRCRATVAVHAEEMKNRTPGGEQRVCETFCDPAGASVNDVTGTSAVRELRGLGVKVRYRRSFILEGIEQVRRSLRNGDGERKLLISPRCERLIAAMRCYHYPERSRDGGVSELPVKDGVNDHYIDALRYFFVNYNRSNRVRVRMY